MTQQQVAQQKLAAIIANHADIPRTVGERVACVIRIEEAGDYSFAVQYWTRSQIQDGLKINGNGARCYFLHELA